MKTKCGIQKGNDQRKNSCSQMHSSSVKFVPVTEFINETSVHTQYNCDEFRFWWENPKNYLYFKIEKAASFLQMHSTGQSLMSLEGVLFQTSPPPIPTASAFSGACWGDSGTCHDLQPTSSFHQRKVLFLAKVPLIYQILFLNFIWQR